MRFAKPFIHKVCGSAVKLLLVTIGSSLLICCVRDETKTISPAPNQITIAESAININTASVQELEKLPHVGEKTARNIIEHRTRYGKFRRAEHLLLVDGVSDEHFRAMRNFVAVE